MNSTTPVTSISLHSHKIDWQLTVHVLQYGDLIFYCCSFLFHLAGSRTNPAWDHYDERNVHFLVALFGFHMCGNLIFIMVAYLGTYAFVKMRGAIKGSKKPMVLKGQYVPLSNAEDSALEEEDV